MKININLPALYTHKTYKRNVSSLTTSLKRLSSGFRINEAADDASGMAISEKMKRSIRGMKKARQNSLDDVSLIQTFEGALDEVHAMLQRLRELSVQGASESYKNEDRLNIQAEMTELRDQIDKISDFTAFNDVYLLKSDNLIEYGERVNGQYTEKTEKFAFQIGGEKREFLELDISEYRSDSSTINLPIIRDDGGSKIEFRREIPTVAKPKKDTNGDGAIDMKDLVLPIGEDGQSIEKRDYFLVDNIDTPTTTPHTDTNGDGKIDENDLILDTNGDGNVDMKDHVVFKEVALLGDMKDEYKENDYYYMDYSVESSGERRYYNNVIGDIMEKNGYDKDTDMKDIVEGFVDNEYKNSLMMTDEEYNELKTAYNTVKAKTKDPILDNLPTPPTDADIAKYNTEFENYYKEINDVVEKYNLDRRYGLMAGDIPIKNNLGKDALLQRNDASLRLEARMKSLDATKADASQMEKYTEKVEELLYDGKGKIAFNESLKMVDRAISDISYKRAKLGAIQNRLESVIRSTDVNIENLTESRSRIFDVDMAEEFSEYTKNKILQESSTAMIGHANQMPQAVLQLLNR